MLLNNQTNNTSLNMTTLGNSSTWENQSTLEGQFTWGNSSILGNSSARKNSSALANTFSFPRGNILTNDTLFCQQERSNITFEDTLTKFVFIFIYATFGFCGVLINTYVVWLIKMTHQWRSLTIRLIMYLSVVDIMCCICNFLRLMLFFIAEQVT